MLEYFPSRLRKARASSFVLQPQMQQLKTTARETSTVSELQLCEFSLTRSNRKAGYGGASTPKAATVYRCLVFSFPHGHRFDPFMTPG